MASSSLWQRFQRYLLEDQQHGFSLDISRMKFPDDLFEKMRPQIERAFASMRELEAGAIANPTEKRMVGHYWLRNPALAPTPQIRSEIEDMIGRIKAFAEDVHAGKISVENGSRFKHLLHIGIGGSALGPQFVSAAITMSIREVNAFYIGAVIAPYERAVGFYGSLVNINAYDSPESKRARKRRANCCSSRSTCARSFPEARKLPKRSRAQSMPTQRTFFTCYGIWRATIPSIKVAVGEEAADDQFSLGKSK